jgi:hypothetical protein
MEERQRCYIDAEGPDDEAVRIGLIWLAEASRTAEGGTLHAPGLENFRSLSHIVGNIDAIVKNKVFTLNAVPINLATLRTGSVAGAVLALWTDDKMLQEIEDWWRPPAICAIPWLRRHIARWVEAHGPTELRSGTIGATKTVANPVVIEALNSLTLSVNLGTGLGHPSDHDAAVWTFRALKDAREAFDPDEVRAWAAAHRWQMRHAEELGDIAEKVLDGRRIKTHSRPWKSNIVSYWRERAGSSAREEGEE